MKKLLIIFTLIYIGSCSNLIKESEKIEYIDCPTVFFSSENKVFVDGDFENLDLETINYKASLNNYGFDGNCISDSTYNKIAIDLLIIVEPINPIIESINLTIFALIYDFEGNLIDRQYFRINDEFKYNQELSNYAVTDIIGKIKIIADRENEVDSIVLGFVKID